MAFIKNRISRNLNAFLDMLAYAEGTSTSPITKNDGYDVIVTGVDGMEIFTHYGMHPFAGGRKSKRINSKGLTSNASGRYQFMLKDYEHYRKLLKLPDFGPESQDRWAIQLIRETGALPLIEAGKFAAAVARVRHLWASLPGAGYKQLERPLAALERVYLAKGGESWSYSAGLSATSLPVAGQSLPQSLYGSALNKSDEKNQTWQTLLLKISALAKKIMPFFKSKTKL